MSEKNFLENLRFNPNQPIGEWAAGLAFKMIDNGSVQVELTLPEFSGNFQDEMGSPKHVAIDMKITLELIRTVVEDGFKA